MKNNSLISYIYFSSLTTTIFTNDVLVNGLTLQ